MIYSPSAQAFLPFLTPPKQTMHLEKLICTTFSLSCICLLELAAALYFAECGQRTVSAGAFKDLALCFWDRDSSGGTDVLSLAKQKLLVFSGNHPMGGSQESPVLLEQAQLLFETCGTAVRIKNGLFHPKMLLACFCEDAGTHWFYRLQIGSGNLTNSGALDLAVQLEGSSGASPEQNPNGAELAPFVAWLYEQRGQDGAAAEVAALAAVNFVPCTPPEARIYSRLRPERIQFACNLPGRPGCLTALRRDPDVQREAIHVYSPFLVPEDEAQERYYLDGKLNVAAYHTNLTRPLLDAKRRTLLSERTFCSSLSSGHLFFHAKAYIAPRSWRIWLGSANASAGGMERNVELMVGFTLELCAVGVGDQLRDLKRICWQAVNASQEEKAHFLLSSDAWTDTGCVPEDKDVQARIQLGRLNAVLEQTDGRWRVRVTPGATGKLTLYDLGEAVTLDGSEEVPWTRTLAAKPNDVLCNLLRAELSVAEGTALGWIPLRWAREEDAPPPRALAGLLEGLTFLDAIPGCASPGFYHPDDSLLARLESYLASYNGSTKSLERLNQSIARLLALDAADGVLPDGEREKVQWLQGLAGQLSGLWKEG